MPAFKLIESGHNFVLGYANVVRSYYIFATF